MPNAAQSKAAGVRTAAAVIGSISPMAADPKIRLAPSLLAAVALAVGCSGDIVGDTDGGPDLSIAADPAGGGVPLTVRFRTATGVAATGHQWDFGDGATSSVGAPQHTFLNPGEYEVRVEAVAPGGR